MDNNTLLEQQNKLNDTLRTLFNNPARKPLVGIDVKETLSEIFDNTLCDIAGDILGATFTYDSSDSTCYSSDRKMYLEREFSARLDSLTLKVIDSETHEENSYTFKFDNDIIPHLVQIDRLELAQGFLQNAIESFYPDPILPFADIAAASQHLQTALETCFGPEKYSDIVVGAAAEAFKQQKGIFNPEIRTRMGLDEREDDEASSPTIGLGPGRSTPSDILARIIKDPKTLQQILDDPEHADPNTKKYAKLFEEYLDKSKIDDFCH